MKDGELGEGRRRSGRKRWIVLAVAVTLVVAGGVYLALRESGVEKRLAALRAAGYPTSFAEMEEYKRLPEGVENAAGLYIEAFNLFVRPSDANVPVFPQGAELPDRGEPLPKVMAEAISEYLKESQECLALLRKAGEIEHCRYDRDYGATTVSYIQETKECAYLLETAVIFYSDKGDTGTALGYFRDGLRLAHSLAGKPHLISYLVRTGCIVTSLSGLERALSVTVFSDEQLRQMDEMLSRTKESLDMTDGLVAERAEVIDVFQDPSLGEEIWQGMEEVTRLMKIPVIGKTGLIDYLDYMADYMEALKLSGMQRIVRLHEIEKEMENQSVLHIVGKAMAPAVARVAEIDLRRRTRIDLARTALAIERYRLAKGELPEKLEELVGEYVEAVPVDPFDDKAIRYERTEPGYALWSVGEDGEDNGGKERDEKKRNEPHDVTFIVRR